MLRQFSLVVLLAACLAGQSRGDAVPLWSPDSTLELPFAEVRARVRFDLPAASCANLPQVRARAALARVQAGETCVYCGWTANGWETLSGLEAGSDEVEVSLTIGPETVVYRVNDVTLVSARTGLAQLPAVRGERVRRLREMGEGELSEVRIGTLAYEATNALAAADWRLKVLPETPNGNYPLVSREGGVIARRTTVEVPSRKMCVLAPEANGGLSANVSDLPYDDAGRVLAFTLAPTEVGFAGHLDDATTGSEHALFLNGGGRLVLRGNSCVSGGIVIEDGLVEFRDDPSAAERSGEVLLWSDTAFVLSEKVGRLELEQRVWDVVRGDSSVETKVAFAPVLAQTGDEAPLEVEPVEESGWRTVRLRIGNATRGFTYGCSAAECLTATFEPCAAFVTAEEDGRVELVARVKADARQHFFRLSVRR